MGATAAPLAIIRPTFGTSPQDAEARMNLQQMAGQQAIQKQVQAENALKLQAMNEDQQDQQTIQQTFQNNLTPDGKLDFDKVQAEIAPKVKYQNLQKLQAIHNQMLQGTIAMDKATREKLLAKNTSIGNEITSLLAIPVEQRAAPAAAARQRLIDLGDIDPNDPTYGESAPLDDQSLKAHLLQIGWAKQIQEQAKATADEEEKKALASKARAKADADEALAKSKQVQQSMEDASRDFRGAQITDQAGHDAWLEKLQKENPEAAKRMPKKFVDSETTGALIDSLAQTSQQRADSIDKQVKAEAEARRALVSGGEPGLAFLAHDPTVSKETNDAAAAALKDVVAAKAKSSGGLTDNERQVQRDRELTRLSTERNRYQTVRDSEVKLWDKTQKLDFAIQAAQKSGSKTVKDPTNGREVSIEAAIAEQASTKAAAQEKNADGKLILQQNQWGEFAPGARQTQPTPGVPPPAVTPPAAQAAPAVTPPAAPAAPKGKKEAGPVTIKLEDGRFLTFPSQEKADAAAKKYGFTYTKGQ